MRLVQCILIVIALSVVVYNYAYGSDHEHVSKRNHDRPFLLIADNKKSESPSAVNDRFITLRDQKRWSEMYDLVDTASKVRLKYETKAAMKQFVSNESDRQRLRSISGRDLFEITMKTSIFHPRRILSEKVKGNHAILRVETILQGRKVRINTYMIKEDGVWKVSFPTDNQPLNKELVE